MKYIIIIVLLLSVPLANSEIAFETFAKVNGPIGIISSGSKFLISMREKENEAISKLVFLSSDGSKVEQAFPDLVGGHEVYFAMSHGLNGFPKNYIYAVSYDAVLEIDPSLTRIRNLSRAYPFDPVLFLAFDTVGTWNNTLLATTEDGSVWSIDVSGKAERIIVLGQHTWLEGIAVAPLNYGKIGGYLILSSKEQEKVIAISPEKPHKIIDIISIAGEQPEHLFFIPPSKDLLIAMNEDKTIARIPAERLKPFVGSMFLVTEGENNRTGSIHSITPSEDSYKVEKLFSTTNPHFEGYTFIEPRDRTSTLAESTLPYLLVAVVAVVIIIAVIKRYRKPA